MAKTCLRQIDVGMFHTQLIFHINFKMKGLMCVDSERENYNNIPYVSKELLDLTIKNHKRQAAENRE